MTRYFKPRKDLEFSSSLSPQKIDNGKQYRYITYYKEWKENGSVNLQSLKDNFIEVDTEEQAIEGY